MRRGLVALLQQYGALEVVGETGIDAVKCLRRPRPRARVLVLTVSEDEQDLAAALRSTAQGYLRKPIDGDVLTDAIRCAAPVVSLEPRDQLVQALRARDGLSPLRVSPAPEMAHGAVSATGPAPAWAPREEEVLRAIARGGANKGIARSLDIAETTGKIHVQHTSFASPN